MTASVVDLEFRQLAVEHQPGRPAKVHECTVKPGRRAYMKFAPAHEANAGGEVADGILGPFCAARSCNLLAHKIF